VENLLLCSDSRTFQVPFIPPDMGPSNPEIPNMEAFHFSTIYARFSAQDGFPGIVETHHI
jgi:hypothetical protein